MWVMSKSNSRQKDLALQGIWATTYVDSRPFNSTAASHKSCRYVEAVVAKSCKEQYFTAQITSTEHSTRYGFSLLIIDDWLRSTMDP